MISELLLVCVAYTCTPDFSVEPQVARRIAKEVLVDKGYAHQQWSCLNKLYWHESRWQNLAYNEIEVMGLHAAGIPQKLGMFLFTPVERQIEIGLKYIKHRYGTPCEAWDFHQRNGWY